MRPQESQLFLGYTFRFWAIIQETPGRAKLSVGKFEVYFLLVSQFQRCFLDYEAFLGLMAKLWNSVLPASSVLTETTYARLHTELLDRLLNVCRADVRSVDVCSCFSGGFPALPLLNFSNLVLMSTMLTCPPSLCRWIVISVVMSCRHHCV